MERSLFGRIAYAPTKHKRKHDNTTEENRFWFITLKCMKCNDHLKLFDYDPCCMANTHSYSHCSINSITRHWQTVSCQHWNCAGTFLASCYREVIFLNNFSPIVDRFPLQKTSKSRTWNSQLYSIVFHILSPTNFPIQ